MIKKIITLLSCFLIINVLSFSALAKSEDEKDAPESSDSEDDRGSDSELEKDNRTLGGDSLYGSKFNELNPNPNDIQNGDIKGENERDDIAKNNLENQKANNQTVEKVNLDLSRSQKEQIKYIFQERKKKIRAEYSTYRQEDFAKIKDILTEQQKNQLQKKLEKRGLDESLVEINNEMFVDLELTDEQKEQIGTIFAQRMEIINEQIETYRQEDLVTIKEILDDEQEEELQNFLDNLKNQQIQHQH